MKSPPLTVGWSLMSFNYLVESVNIIFMRRFHCQLNSALRQPSPAPPANRLVYTSNNAGDWPTKAVSNNRKLTRSFC